MGKKSRTYRYEEKVVDWIDEMAEEHDMDKSEIVNRAVKVYGAKLAKGEWKDPKISDPIDRRFEKR